MKTVKVKHPTLSDVELEVPQSKLSEYLDAGWLEKGQRRKATAKTTPVSDEEPTSHPESPVVED